MSELGRLLRLTEAAGELFGGVRGLDGRVRATEASNLRLRRMIHHDEITAVKVGTRYYISRDVINDITSG